ncbi:GNAT family acetyltransferase [Gordonia sp. ABSL11-1]|uniref:GNAT family acetyltransferase n=1 Tax=Gordonia sp. ABSL11-1 TaxID=3053924 RepID=UPI0025744B44|nr:GNAT family acetyltransferase [Gordonia sp. ABSL11-1]MDL9947211.1 GNAT family acetyltransferase [Gordonia sp. ABSL11-1]
MVNIRPFASADEEAIVALWEESGLTRPWNDPLKDVQRKTKTQPEMFLVAEADHGAVVGSAVVGYDGHRGWIYYLAVAKSHRATGLGKSLVQRAESMLAALDCPKVQLQVRPENTQVIAFYEGLGYSTYEAINLGKRLEDDEKAMS